MTSWRAHHWGYLQLLIHSDKLQWPPPLPHLPSKEDWLEQPAALSCTRHIHWPRGLLGFNPPWDTLHNASTCDLWMLLRKRQKKKKEHTSYTQRLTGAVLMSMQCIICLEGWSGHLLFAHAGVILAFVMPDAHTNKWMKRVIARLCGSLGAEIEVFLMRAITMSERNCRPEQNNNTDGS